MTITIISILYFRFLPNEAARGAPPPAWFETFLVRILENNRSVLSLLGTLPKPFSSQPPKYVRALLYDYRFTHGREQDPKSLIDRISNEHIGKTWYRSFVKIYATANQKDD